MTALSGDGGGGMNAYAGMNQSWRYNPYAAREYEYLQQVAQTSQATGPEEQGGEAVAPRPDGIGFDFNVNATFAVEAMKPQK